MDSLKQYLKKGREKKLAADTKKVLDKHTKRADEAKEKLDIKSMAFSQAVYNEVNPTALRVMFRERQAAESFYSTVATMKQTLETQVQVYDTIMQTNEMNHDQVKLGLVSKTPDSNINLEEKIDEAGLVTQMQTGLKTAVEKMQELNDQMANSGAIGMGGSSQFNTKFEQQFREACDLEKKKKASGMAVFMPPVSTNNSIEAPVHEERKTQRRKDNLADPVAAATQEKEPKKVAAAKTKSSSS